MTFSPTPELNLYVCEIEIAANSALGFTAPALNLGSILLDTGGQISISGGNTINIPANCEAFLTMNAVSDLDGTANSATFGFFTDASDVKITTQSEAYCICRTSTGTWFSGMEVMAILFTSASTRQIKCFVRDASGSQTISIPYNSATAYLPNSSVTIMYTGA
jgi:hypothetical protein